MKIRNSGPVLLGLALGMVVSVGLVTAGRAQQLPGQTIIPSIQYQQADVRFALRDLFKTVGASYSLAPEVQGMVTIELKNVTFETALQNVLRQVDATYRLEGGVYNVFKRTDSPTTTLTSGGQNNGFRPIQPQPTSMTQDGQYLYVIIGNMLEKIQKSDLKIIKTQALNTGGFMPFGGGASGPGRF